MIGRGLGLVGALLLLGAIPGVAGAAPEGPRLATVALEETGSAKDAGADPPTMSLRTIGPLGTQSQRVVSARFDGRNGRVVPSPFYGPSWSFDGSLIAFAGYRAKDQGIYLVSADGTRLHAVPGTKGGSRPVFSPDGHTIAFARTRFRSHVDIKHLGRSRFYASTTTWIVDVNSGESRRLTKWRNGLENVPSSFSPDGSVLALTKSDDHLDGPRVVLARIDGSGSSGLVWLAEEAAISPDGSRIAYIGYQDRDVVEAEENQDYLAGELYVMRIDGSEVKRLTRSNDVIESSPSWDPSGQRIGYVHARADTSFVPSLGLLFPHGNSLMQINTDGTCRKKIASLRKVAFYGVAWQPGLGREAGSIDCS